MSQTESRNQKRKDFVEAIIIRKEPVVLVARVFSIPLRTAFNWLARYRSGGWQALTKNQSKGDLKRYQVRICVGFIMQLHKVIR